MKVRLYVGAACAVVGTAAGYFGRLYGVLGALLTAALSLVVVRIWQGTVGDTIEWLREWRP